MPTWLIGASFGKLAPPALDRLDQLQCPALILSGALEVAEFLCLGALLECEIPRAQRVLVQGAAHMVSMEKPAEFNQLVAAFIA